MTEADVHEARLGRLRAALADAGHPGLVVTDLVNIRYLCGFTGSNGLLLVPTIADPIFLTDGRYVDQARAEVTVDDQRVARDLFGSARDHGLTAWVAETHRLTVDQWRSLGEPAGAGTVVEDLRIVKDASELAALRRACEVSVESITALWSGPLEGRSEREIALRLEHLMREHGADNRAFETIVAGGPNSAIPHHQPGDRILMAGDLLKIDFGAKIDGYHADCTRTVVIGSAADWQREIHGVVREVQAAGVAGLREGTSVATVDGLVRGLLRKEGWLESFTTGLGHGVGLQIHEDPFFSASGAARLERCMVLTMEPGIYLAGRGGVRIEDTVQVTDAEPLVLTNLTTELMEIT